ncbi:biopolymer transporter ExbD [Halorhodospira abdelmalekii]|uniref:ExbD/TolR family protein n=1 Tax=Halorhodospira abdelmalekii TaxID=421629 RepID=UPI0019070B0F|nr:biopolymer transporter ExbD [Halorhodospira abdelmalekii]MBK1734615.1 biopolymer transporter ExbD [Halorhodospira abdelmalekii]
MNLRGRRRREEPEINLTPLIDVVFLLLIFFMVTTTFVHDAGLEITLPQAQSERPERAPQLLEVRISAEGEYAVAGEALINRRIETLVRAMRTAMAEEEFVGVVIQADADAPHRAVVQALDGAGRLGIERVSIATVPAPE